MANLVDKPGATSVPTPWKLIQQFVDANPDDPRIEAHRRELEKRRRVIKKAMKELSQALAELNNVAVKGRKR
jgi:hypothetical protein